MSSIGLTEHIGVRNYPAYFRFLQSRLRPGGLLLNHCITRPDNTTAPSTRGFIDRYVFPDGELTGSGRIITEAQDVGLEVLHEENLRQHYALTLRDWCANLVEHWDEAVAEVGRADREGLGPVHGRVAARVRAQRHPAAPGAGRAGPTTAAATATCRCGRGGRPEDPSSEGSFIAADRRHLTRDPEEWATWMPRSPP